MTATPRPSAGRTRTPTPFPRPKPADVSDEEAEATPTETEAADSGTELPKAPQPNSPVLGRPPVLKGLVIALAIVATTAVLLTVHVARAARPSAGDDAFLDTVATTAVIDEIGHAVAPCSPSTRRPSRPPNRPRATPSSTGPPTSMKLSTDRCYSSRQDKA
jgi:hypothetical protein